MYKSSEANTKQTITNWSTDPYYVASMNNNQVARINAIYKNQDLERANGPKSTVIKKSYWKWTFIITLFPFYLWGMPVHLLFGKYRITNTGDWLKKLFSCWPNPISGFLSVILVPVTIGINGYVFYCFGDIINELLIKAEPGPRFWSDVSYLYQAIPVIIPLDYVWIFGYKIRNLLSEFDKIVIPVSRPYKSDIPRGVSSIPSGRVLLVIMYFMIFVIQVIHIVLEYKKVNLETTEQQIYYWATYAGGTFMYALMLPVYATLCWAVRYEFQVLASYISILMEDRQPATIELLDDFKRAYKRAADHVLEINSICSIYMSWVLPVLGFGLYTEVFGIWDEFFDILMGEERGEAKAASIRMLVGDVVVIITEALLGFVTIWQAVKANDEARYLHVYLNDFVTTPEANLNSEVYMAFRMLKYYVHSRMEQPKPALLSISFLSLIPFLRNRMLVYNVYH